MAKALRAERAPHPALTQTGAAPLFIGLADPGMTPLLRAGLGGLAAALWAIQQERDPSTRWPAPVALGPGSATVEPRRVVLSFGDGRPEEVLKILFEQAFRIESGIIDLAGSRNPRTERLTLLAAAEQAAWKRTFLQHGSTTKKAGAAGPRTVEIDDHPVTIQVQPYASFVHQGAWKVVLEALDKGSAELAGWAYPGAAQRHIAFGATRWSFSAGQALCACFSLIGCRSFQMPGNGGALAILEPTDLVAFARRRWRLGPKGPQDVYMSGLGDAVLSVELALYLEGQQDGGQRGGVGPCQGVLLRTTPWAKQQKSRVRTVQLARRDPKAERALREAYHGLTEKLPTSLRIRKGKGTGDEEEGDEGFFFVASAFRGFVADNLAAGRPWYEGFSIATTEEKKPRRIHQYRAPDNLGALYPNEKKGIIAMIERLDEAERALVNSVHLALRGRFGKIHEETKELPGPTRKNRFDGEREKWRLAFAGAKTQEQVRFALADLWSRGGANQQLRTSWEAILPLLRAERWQAARDLALIALASYGKRDDAAPDDGESDNNEIEQDTGRSAS